MSEEIYMGLSHSEIETFLSCEKKHDYSYGQKLEPISRSQALITGTNVHALLEYHYNLQMQHQQAGTWNEETELEVGKQVMLKAFDTDPSVINYYTNVVKSAPFSNWEILAVEKKFELKLPNGMTYTFIIDLIVRDSMGRIVIVDHKTTYDFYQPLALSILPQLVRYMAALRALGFPADAAAYSQIRKRNLKNPSPEDLYRYSPINVTEHRIQEVFREMLISAERILSRRKIPLELSSRNSVRHASDMGCKNCSFKTLCQAELLNQDVEATRSLDYQRKKSREEREAEKNAGG